MPSQLRPVFSRLVRSTQNSLPEPAPALRRRSPLSGPFLLLFLRRAQLLAQGGAPELHQQTTLSV